SIDIVDDEVFSKHILGDGIAIEPTEGKLFAPADGVIDNIFDTNHAVNIITDDGCEILLHIGIDTVELGGKYFTPHVKNGQKVSRGDLLISFDKKGITDSGYKIITPMVICNSDEYSDIEPLTDGEVLKDTQILRLNVK
ncbi:MAG: PTS glucose transporter subunit IIA, partial [Clostridia bacterium]|nr:PTS glucose transporter subunit IIA [Clostridia bacterium]